MKRGYRDILRGGAPRVRFLHIHGPRDLQAERLNHRAGHFFPPKLLGSQLKTLEPLQPDENGVVVDLALPGEEQLRMAVRLLGVG